MGFSPDDLLMLRMSREEFEKINDLFLSPKQREEMNRYGLELKKVKLEFEKISQSVLIDFAEPFIKLSKIIERIWNGIYKVIIKPIMLGFKIISETIKGVVKFSQDLIKSLANAFEILKPILAIFRAIYLIFQDIATYYTGGESYFGDFIEGLSQAADKVKDMFKFETPAWVEAVMSWFNRGQEPVQPNERGEYFSRPEDKPLNMTPVNTNQLSQNTNNINTNNQFTINSNQPTEKIAQGLINTFTPSQVQFSTVAL
jgi:hypothetical protein